MFISRKKLRDMEYAIKNLESDIAHLRDKRWDMQHQFDSLVKSLKLKRVDLPPTLEYRKD